MLQETWRRVARALSLLAAVSFLALALVVGGPAALADGPTEPPTGEVPWVDATEIEGTAPALQEEEAGPPLRPDHPPIDEIPSMPMPQRTEGSAESAGPGSPVVHDAETEETIALPADDAALSGGFGQGGGYSGVDGGGGSERVSASFYDMYQITNTGDSPWRMNAKLVMRFEDAGGGDHWYVCSGTMRDAATVLTAGHCVYDRSNGYGWAEEVWVYPGYDGDDWWLPPPSSVGPYGWGHGTYFGSWTGWTNDGNWDNDLGLVGVTRAVGMLTGWFGWSYGEICSWHTSQTYHNASYPNESCPIAGLHTGLDMYYWYGNFDACPGNQLQLNTGGGNCFDTVWGGMSGSGAYFIAGGNRYVHAVASTSNRNDRGWYVRQWEDWVAWSNNTFIPNVRQSSFDLQPLDVNAEPATIEAGDSTTLQNHLATNPTDGSADGNWTFRVYLSDNDDISSSDTLLSTQWFAWNAGAMSSIRVNMTSIGIPQDTPEGDYWLGVEYDPATDGNSGNNDTDTWDAVPIHVRPFCWADIDDDDDVDAIDVQDVASRWRESAGSRYDRDSDGIVTAIDILGFVAEWGSCP